jgi:hypothetical protein
MSKNIVVLSDGTGQEGGKGHDTNIYKIFRMLEDRTEDQVVFYDRGIGTDWRKITGNIAGAGFNQNVLQCYRFIYDNYNSGDKIFLLGFSRGAATVRSLASFINYFGILPKSRPELIKKAFKLYRMGRETDKKTSKELETKDDAPNSYAQKQDGGDDKNPKNWVQQGMQSLVDIGNKTKEGLQQVIRGEPLNKKAEKFIHEHPNQWVSIEFLGVYDTVPALGLPGAVIDTFVNLIPGWKHRFHDFKLHPSVNHAYQALSIDDDRKWFHPTIWHSCPRDDQTIEQVWFSGAHTDVGGGFREPGLSDIALEWMIQKAVAHGIKLYLRNIKYWNFCIAPDTTDKMHPPREGFGRIYPAKQRGWPKEAQMEFGPPTIHQSVIERTENVKDYKPWILREFPDYKIEPWTETFKYNGDENFFIRDYDKNSWETKFSLNGNGSIDVNDPQDFYSNLLKRGEWSDNRLKRDLDRWQGGQEK